jgi:hypothetical protein
MKTLDDYMNNPEIVNEPTSLREIHAIRLMLYDEIKNMTPKAFNEHVNKKTDKIMKLYGLEHLASSRSI